MRRRRHWGWGYEDDPVGEGAAELAAHLGFGSAELERPAPLRVDPDRALHAHGASYLDVVRALRGDFPHLPDVVVRPADEAGVLRALERADADDLAVTPYGGGTSVVGGVDPVAGGMSLDLGGLDRVLEVDPVSRAARIQAGATGPRIEEQLAEHGMTLRFYPAVVRTLDARRLDRHPRRRPFRHRPDAHRRPRRVDPGDHARAASVGVAPAARLGRRAVARPPAARLRGHAGRDHRGVGDRIRPRDEPRWSARVELDDFAAGLELVREIVQSGMRPSNCRLVEAREAQLTLSGDRTTLHLGFEGAHEPVERVRALCERYGDVIEGARRRLARRVPARAVPARHAGAPWAC